MTYALWDIVIHVVYIVGDTVMHVVCIGGYSYSCSMYCGIVIHVVLLRGIQLYM